MANEVVEPGFMPEALPPRERNILAHLANNKSSQEIAGLETLVYSTVKWYIHQIYAKLGVNKRRDAITRARELGLLRPDGVDPGSTSFDNNNLPRQLTSFIGREEEISQLLTFVQELPLVTLTGSGGTGKTRLALQVAGRALQSFADGAWFVDLTPLTDPGLVPLVTATTLGMREIPRAAAVQALSEFIGRKCLLLILDNCEHLIGAAASLANELLQACPQLHILATSREVLGVQGEKTFRCPPLSLPDPHTEPAFIELTQSEAVRLFDERAQAVSSGFHLSEANAPIVLNVCRRLDGIPLAIELAAARVRLLSPEQIAARLNNIFHLLIGGGRTAPPRHQTMKALVDWSFNLLSAKERRLLCRLSVFTGGWTLEASEKVCADSVEEGPLLAEEILNLLGQLVDKSLVSVQDGPVAQPRYHMLEMIRQYAHHRLEEDGEEEEIREHHLDYFLYLSLQAEVYLRAAGSREWKERLDVEIDNLRLAMDWSLSGSIEKGLRLAAALQWFWHGTRYRPEGLGWLNRLLAADATGVDSQSVNAARMIARGKALNAATWIGILIGQINPGMAEEAAGIFEQVGDQYQKDLIYSYFLARNKGLKEVLDSFRQLGDPFMICEILEQLSMESRWKGDLRQTRSYIEEQLHLRREIEDKEGEGSGLWELGVLEFLEGNPKYAGELFHACRVCLQEAGANEISPFIYSFQAWIALAQGDYQQAIQISQKQLEKGKEYYISWVTVHALGFLGWEAMSAGNIDLAVQHCEEALKLIEQVEPDILAVTYYVLARVAIARRAYAQAYAHLKEMVTHNFYSWPPVQLGIQLFGILAAMQMEQRPEQARRAATLFGAQDAIHECLMNVIPQPERDVYHQSLASVRGAMSTKDFASAFAVGKAMTTAQAIQYALAE